LRNLPCGHSPAGKPALKSECIAPEKRGPENSSRQLYPKPPSNAATPAAAIIALLTVAAVLLPGVSDQPAAADQRLIENALVARTDVVGTMIRLPVGQTEAAAIYRSGQLADTRGAVLILHAPGSNADDPTIVRPLRIALSDAGWDTLAVQLPSRFQGESPNQWLARNDMLRPVIAGASKWLEERGQLNQALLGVGTSGQAALVAAAQTARPLRALVLISTPLPAESDAAARLGGTELPVLDLVAQRDLPAVIDSRPLKRRLANGKPRFTQREVPGAAAGFVGMEGGLTSTVRAWLAANADRSRLD
jgi:pimeloyl-ACP methyl ester carboxylesterase